MPGSQVVHAPSIPPPARSSSRRHPFPPSLRREDERFQDHILPGVSRTFALTIPQLPERLGLAVTNAYLLCRIADTIEDAPGLAAEERATFHEDFLAALSEEVDAEAFAGALAARVSAGTPAAERELVAGSPHIVRIMNSLGAEERGAIRSCVTVMSRGMDQFSRKRGTGGLASVRELERYCYFVAGVVGEMLTALFCVYSEEIAAERRELMRCAVSFGQGLQMTNILKDIWEDLEDGACWLPRDAFGGGDWDLQRVRREGPDAAFVAGMHRLVAIAHVKLRDALHYTLLIPRHEGGIRRFLVWAIGLAVLTLRRIDRTPGFTSGAQVKVSRRTVRTLVTVTSAAVRSNASLEALFFLSARGLPLPPSQTPLSGAHRALPFPTSHEHPRRKLR